MYLSIKNGRAIAQVPAELSHQVCQVVFAEVEILARRGQPRVLAAKSTLHFYAFEDISVAVHPKVGRERHP